MKKTLWTIFIFVLLVSTYVMVDTYGLLESRATADIDKSIGKWKISINGFDVLETEELTFKDLSYQQNSNVENGFFAPGSVGSYEIEIDPTGTDVAVRYDIVMDLASVELHPNIIFSVSGLPMHKLEDGKIGYSNYIPLTLVKSGTSINLSIVISWINDDNYNELDSTLMCIDSELSIPMSINFSQYVGEAF